MRPDTLPDDLAALHRRAGDLLGQPVHLIDMTAGLGVPAYWAHTRPAGPGRAARVRGCGASLSARYAAERTLTELIQIHSISTHEPDPQAGRAPHTTAYPALHRCYLADLTGPGAVEPVPFTDITAPATPPTTSTPCCACSTTPATTPGSGGGTPPTTSPCSTSSPVWSASCSSPTVRSSCRGDGATPTALDHIHRLRTSGPGSRSTRPQISPPGPQASEYPPAFQRSLRCLRLGTTRHTWKSALPNPGCPFLTSDCQRRSKS